MHISNRSGESIIGPSYLDKLKSELESRRDEIINVDSKLEGNQESNLRNSSKQSEGISEHLPSIDRQQANGTFLSGRSNGTRNSIWNVNGERHKSQSPISEQEDKSIHKVSEVEQQIAETFGFKFTENY